jgi:hypothetical protein
MPISKSNKRWILRLAAILTGGLALLLWTYQKTTSHLAIENKSGQAIALLRVTVAEHTTTFRDIAAGAAVEAPLGDKSGDTFAIDGQLADGTLIRGRGVAGGGQLVVGPGGVISVRQREKGS